MKKLVSLFAICLLLSVFSGLVLASDIVIWDREKETEDIVKLFNAKLEAEGRKERVEFQLVPYEQQTQKFLAALAAGNAPDVISLDIILNPYFNSIGAFMDLTDRINALEFRDALPQGMLELGAWEGRYYGIPFTVDLSGLVWHKPLFRESGLDPEKPSVTWDDLIEYGTKLTKDFDNDGNIDQYGFAIIGASAGWQMFGFLPIIWSNGGRLLSEDGSEVMIDRPEAIEALDFWTSLIHEHKIAPKNAATWQYADVYNSFITNKTAMMLSGNFNVMTFKQDAPDLEYGITYTPKAKGGQHYSFSGGNLIAISRDTKAPDLAWEFVEFSLSPDVQVEIWAKNGALPVRSDLYDNKYFDAEPIYKVFADILKVARAPFSTKYNELYAPMLAGMQKAMMGTVTPEEAYKEAAKEMRRVLAD